MNGLMEEIMKRNLWSSLVIALLLVSSAYGGKVGRTSARVSSHR